MKKLILILLVLIIAVPAFADVYVSGYTRKDGTYVRPHHRSNPDGNPYNNYSYPGNNNPYTGDYGYNQPAPYNGGGSRKSTIFGEPLQPLGRP